MWGRQARDARAAKAGSPRRVELEVRSLGPQDPSPSSFRRGGFSLLSGDDTGGSGGESELGGTRLDEARQHLSSDTRTFVNLLISFVGAGILGIPFAFRQGGLLLSTVCISLVGAVCTYCMWMLVRSKYRVMEIRGPHDRGPVKYADVCHEALGKPGLVAVETALVASQAGFSTAYLVFIARNLNALFSFRKAPVILLCLPGLAALCLIKHLKYLAPFSLIAEVVNLTGLLVVFFDDVEFMGINHESISMAHWGAFPFVFGVAVYCFEGMGMIIPVEDAMLNRQNFTPILSIVMVIYTALCVLSGGMGYLAFGDATEDIILLNIGSTTSTLIVKISFCVGLYFTFPIMMVPVWEVLEFKWLKGGPSSPSYERDRNAVRCGTVLATGVLACLVPNFGLFVSLIGSSCCSLLAFILPTMCYSRLERRVGLPLSRARSILNNLILAAGIFAMISGTADTLKRIMLEYYGNTGAGDARL